MEGNRGSIEYIAESCLDLKKSLFQGRTDATTNGEVSRLQAFLKAKGDYDYPEVTGYFGPVTERAVQKWQERNGVVSSGSISTTGYGVVGPKTRTSFSDLCSVQSSDTSSTPEISSLQAFIQILLEQVANLKLQLQAVQGEN